jgi:flagellar hook-associated protein 2
MVTEITLGSFGTQNGKNVLTGGASKIDTKGLIDSLVAARRIPADRLVTRNETIDSQTDALNTLRTLFTKFQSAADVLRNPPGVANDSKNIFQYRKASLTSTSGATTSNYLDVTIVPGAVAQSYTVDSITQLAKQTKQQSGNFVLADATTASAVTAGPTPGLFQAGTFNLRAVDGTMGGIAVTLTAGDSLQTVANKFNEVSSRTGIQASILTVSPGTYKIIYTATKTGSTYGFDLGLIAPAAGAGVASDPSGVLSQLAPTTTTQAAQNALFSIDGVALERETNSVDNVLTGVTFTLKQDTVPGAINLNIVPDTTLIANSITAFADAYNEFRVFASKQSQLGEDSAPAEDSVLYNNSTFRNIINSVSTEIARVVAGITGLNPTQLVDVGITIENFPGDAENPETKNILVVDPDKLSSSLLANFDGARKLFEYQQSSNDGNFVSFKRSNTLGSITGFSVAINRTTNTYQATYTDPITLVVTTVDLDGSPIDGGGVGLKGKVGTVFEGSEFLYAVGGDATIDVTLSQGFGDRFFNLINSFIDVSNGTLTQEVNTLAENKTRNTEQITTIDDKLTSYRDQLVKQYASLESALSRANQLLQLLDAQSNARNSN